MIYSYGTPETSKSSTLKRKKSTAILSSNEEEQEENLPPRKKPALKHSVPKPPQASTSRKQRDEDEDFDMESNDDDEFVEEEKPVKPQKRKTPVKKASSSKADKPIKEEVARAKEPPRKFECVPLLIFLFQHSFSSVAAGRQRKRPN